MANYFCSLLSTTFGDSIPNPLEVETSERFLRKGLEPLSFCFWVVNILEAWFKALVEGGI